MDASQIGKVLLVGAAVLAVTGLVLMAISGLGVGRLPGDMSFGGRRFRVFVPVATSILLSVVATIVLNLLLRR